MSQALFNIIEGKVNPSGKLPVSVPNTENEMGLTTDQHPGINDISHYTEKLHVGYRWYDFHNVAPNYPFGHGLSYTTFTYHGDYI